MLQHFRKINKGGNTVVHLLASFGYTDLLKECIMQDNQFINLLNNNNENVLNILYNDYDFIKWVNDNDIENANFNNITNENHTVIVKNIIDTKSDGDINCNIIEYLLSFSDININIPSKNPPLCLCCKLNKKFITDILLENANINANGNENANKNANITANKNANKNVNKNVNENENANRDANGDANVSVDLNIKDDNFISPFLYACKNKCYDSMKGLINHINNLNINYIGPEGEYNPMIYAIEINDNVMIDILLKNKFDVDMSDKHLNTPLHHTFRKKDASAEIVAKLIYYGNLNLKNLDGETPFHLLCQYSLHTGLLGHIKRQGHRYIHKK